MNHEMYPTPPAMTAAKSALRAAVKARLQAVPPAVRAAKSARIAECVTALPAWRSARSVSVFLSMPHELDTMPLVHAALADGKRVYVPYVAGRRSPMVMVAVDDAADVAALPRDKWGIPTPTTPSPRTGAPRERPLTPLDLVIVPGVAFTSPAGARIGYGAGYYDSYLATPEATDAVRVAVALADVQIVDCVPTEPHDARMHWLVTDEGAVECCPSSTSP
ncbi:hypothetical protein H9P43_010088 [Blastocladiella emersonii ATCC 22665]|nr:hypothetical protein H9P43_010088 [Blastocladiella emersonii ATCC 22665]